MSEAEFPEGAEPVPGDVATQTGDMPDELPLLPVRDVVVFPYMILPLFVGRDRSVAAVDKALQGNRMIFLCTQQEMSVEDPEDEDLHEMIFKAQTLSAKLAGALDSLAYDEDADGGFVVACLKRALQFFQAAIAGSDKVQSPSARVCRELETQCSTALDENSSPSIRS